MQETLPDGTIVQTPNGVGQVVDAIPNTSGTNTRYTVHLGNGDMFYFWQEDVKPIQSGMIWTKMTDREPSPQDGFVFLICHGGQFDVAEWCGDYFQANDFSVGMEDVSHWLLIEKPDEGKDES